MSVVKGNEMEEWLKRVEKKGEGLMDETVLCFRVIRFTTPSTSCPFACPSMCMMQQRCFGCLCGGWCLLRKRQSGDCVLWQSSANVDTHSIHSSVCFVFVKPKLHGHKVLFPHTHDGEVRVKEC